MPDPHNTGWKCSSLNNALVAGGRMSRWYQRTLPFKVHPRERQMLVHLYPGPWGDWLKMADSWKEIRESMQRPLFLTIRTIPQQFSDSTRSPIQEINKYFPNWTRWDLKSPSVLKLYYIWHYVYSDTIYLVSHNNNNSIILWRLMQTVLCSLTQQSTWGAMEGTRFLLLVNSDVLFAFFPIFIVSVSQFVN